MIARPSLQVSAGRGLRSVGFKGRTTFEEYAEAICSLPVDRGRVATLGPCSQISCIRNAKVYPVDEIRALGFAFTTRLCWTFLRAGPERQSFPTQSQDTMQEHFAHSTEIRTPTTLPDTWNMNFSCGSKKSRVKEPLCLWPW